eukprot:CAMPEP_0201973290 /NCGR_PEP_ID=MMETSP0904-20121228/45686_1 /ASSEMBLY_ACC=CAM_ASM_000553 /TAXON_ID=420261 /ORGANISM="Thalassiosira antarctica, Strain CCMP982" /LENGTH=48 /DNA_ID= /DNA_START= /DNA_END= /DNA_ORIENTATION=
MSWRWLACLARIDALEDAALCLDLWEIALVIVMPLPKGMGRARNIEST